MAVRRGRHKSAGRGKLGCMYRYAGPIAAVLLAALAVTGCKTSVSVVGSGTPSAPASPISAASVAASIAAAATASALPSFSIPGTHESVQSFQVTAPVSTLDVTSHLGDITITGSSSNTVSVTEQMAYSSTLPVTSHAVAGGTLTVGYTCPAQAVCGVAYIITVPRGVTVTATTATGAIRLSGLTGPSLTAKVDAGFIDATSLSVADASFTVDVGGVTATFTAAPQTLSATTKAGGIALHVPTTTDYQVSATGKSTITVPESTTSAHTITASTDVGAIQIAP
jgi:hypothetical protein